MRTPEQIVADCVMRGGSGVVGYPQLKAQEILETLRRAGWTLNRLDDAVLATTCVFPMVEECLMVYPTEQRVGLDGVPVEPRETR